MTLVPKTKTFLSTLQAIGQKGSNMTHLIIEFISVILVTMMLLHIILLITGNEKDSFIEITNFDLFFHRHVFNMITHRPRSQFILFLTINVALSSLSILSTNFVLGILVYYLPFLILKIYNIRQFN